MYVSNINNCHCVIGEMLISKAVAATKRDDVHYKDIKGRRKQEQEWSEKCKRQWLKVQRERREFVNQMHKAADQRDKHKKRMRFCSCCSPPLFFNI